MVSTTELKALLILQPEEDHQEAQMGVEVEVELHGPVIVLENTIVLFAPIMKKQEKYMRKTVVNMATHLHVSIWGDCI